MSEASGSTLEWRIERTWSGRPVGDDEAARIRLEAAPAGWTLWVEAPFHDDPPPLGSPGPTPGLWDFEVVELFLSGADEHYLEVELGPRGHHLVLRLEGRRRPVAEGLPLEVEVAIAEGRWSARAHLPEAWAPAGPHRANAYAIHGCGDQRRYLACHPTGGPRPDFHRLEAFEPVTLPAPLPSEGSEATEG